MSSNFQLSQPTQQTHLKVVAVIPCYNTEYSISGVVSKARKYVDQVIVLNDGSRDGTAEAAKAAGALVINHGTRMGYGDAIKSCFEAAKGNKADILVTLDGDGQHNPDELPQVLAPLLTGEADLVIGSRFLRLPQPTQQTQSTQQTNMPGYRKFGINVITFLYNFGSRIKVSDSQSGFRAYSKKILDTISLTEKGMGISVEVILKARERGFSIKEVPISCTYHSKSSTINPVSHGFGVAFTVVKLRFRNARKRLNLFFTKGAKR